MNHPVLTSRFLRYALPAVLLAVMAAHASRTFGSYVVGDDLKWTIRAADDAHRPWNVFGESLFPPYYRPVASIVWLMNYAIWGFNFDGHQAMFIGMWLAAVGLVCLVGRRLGGWPAGLIAAALVGLNDIYLLVVTWKSWYTTLIEYTVVMGWMWCFIRWVETRGRKHLVGWLILSVAGILSRELAPLIFSATVFVVVVLPELTGPRTRRRGMAWAGIWAGATLTVLLALPSYRAMAMGLLHQPQAASAAATEATGLSAAPESAPGEAPLKRFVARFRSHAMSIFGGADTSTAPVDGALRRLLPFAYGLSPYLLFLAALCGLVARKVSTQLHNGRWQRILLGAAVIGCAVLALPAGARALGEQAAAGTSLYIRPIWYAGLLLFFLAAAARGDRWDRMLGAWFVVSFVPVLFLEHSSNAYHLLAFTALALYVGRKLSDFLENEALPLRRQDGQPAAHGEERDARLALVWVAAALVALQLLRLVNDVSLVQSQMRSRVAAGRQFAAMVRTSVHAMLNSGDDWRTVWVGPDEMSPDPLGPYARLATVVLREEHGFTVRSLDPTRQVGLRRMDLPLLIYSDAVTYDDALFRRFNVLPDPGFEQDSANPNRAPSPRTGRYALASRTSGAQPEEVNLEFGPFRLAPGTACVFGGFLRREATAGRLCMELRSASGERYAVATPPARQTRPEWELVWQCSAPPEGSRSFMFRCIRGQKVSGGRILADDIFLCPVEPLIQAARTMYAP